MSKKVKFLSVAPKHFHVHDKAHHWAMQPDRSRRSENLFAYNSTPRPPLFYELLLLLPPDLALLATRKVFKATVDGETRQPSAGSRKTKIRSVEMVVIEILVKAQSAVFSDNQARFVKSLNPLRKWKMQEFTMRIHNMAGL